MENKKNNTNKVPAIAFIFVFIFIVLAFLWIFVYPVFVRKNCYSRAINFYGIMLKATKDNMEANNRVIQSSKEIQNTSYSSCFLKFGLKPEELK